jgi:hypothetical protein
VTELACGSCGSCPFRNGQGSTPENKYRAALVYAALGFAVYPSAPDSQAHCRGLGVFKGPDGKGGWHLATTDVGLINTWKPFWERPDSCLSIATGAWSRLVVIDQDIKQVPREVERTGSVSFGQLYDEIVGAESLRKWEADTGHDVPRDVVSSTPGRVTDPQTKA